MSGGIWYVVPVAVGVPLIILGIVFVSEWRARSTPQPKRFTCERFEVRGCSIVAHRLSSRSQGAEPTGIPHVAHVWWASLPSGVYLSNDIDASPRAYACLGDPIELRLHTGGWS